MWIYVVVHGSWLFRLAVHDLGCFCVVQSVLGVVLHDSGSLFWMVLDGCGLGHGWKQP